jgi:hypothetical protein
MWNVVMAWWYLDRGIPTKNGVLQLSIVNSKVLMVEDT